jgi:ubiquinone/menaquinone biosynthesis C-methylase UbiE
MSELDMPFGSIFHNFSDISLTTANDIQIDFKNNFLTKIGFKILGMPHIELRLRARKIIKNIPIQAARMLDAGFGSGIYSFTLSDRVKMIEAIDIDERKLNYVKQVNSRFSNIHFQKMDITDLTFTDHSFDLIICSDVLEQITHHELAISELARVLKRGGILIITVPYDSENNRIMYKYHSNHVRPGYSEQDMQTLCDKSSLKIIKIEKYSYFISDKVSKFCSKIAGNKPMVALLFYPFYSIAMITDMISFRGNPNGMFLKIIKI